MLSPLLDTPQPTDNPQPSPADRWLWAVLGALVVGLFAAFWLLCREQVEKAEAREATLRAERIAAMDECAPKDGRATCLPVSTRRPPAARAVAPASR